MDDDEYRMREAIKRIENRITKISIIRAGFDSELNTVLNDAQTDIKSLRMQLDANRATQAPVDSKQNKN